MTVGLVIVSHSIQLVAMMAISPNQVRAEQQRLQQALDAAIGELRELSEHVAQTVGRNAGV